MSLSGKGLEGSTDKYRNHRYTKFKGQYAYAFFKLQEVTVRGAAALRKDT